VTRRVLLAVAASAGALAVGWLSEDRGWTRFVGVLAILAALATFVVLDARRDR
jgi:hypothetical protein